MSLSIIIVRFIKFLFSLQLTLLVIIHIPNTQKRALPFPCSKTKSEISFSHGWAQAVITTRRYFFGNVQSENMFINYKIGIVYMFYMHNVVTLSTNSKHTKMGGTLPAFKYEIVDFFFTRLGTGKTLKCRPATSRTDAYTKKYLEMI